MGRLSPGAEGEHYSLRRPARRDWGWWKLCWCERVEVGGELIHHSPRIQPLGRMETWSPGRP